jgi:hypothetical protein
MFGTAARSRQGPRQTHDRVSTLKVSGKIAGMAEGGAELEFKQAEERNVTKLRSAFAAFDRSKNRGLFARAPGASVR